MDRAQAPKLSKHLLQDNLHEIYQMYFLLFLKVRAETREKIRSRTSLLLKLHIPISAISNIDRDAKTIAPR